MNGVRGRIDHEGHPWARSGLAREQAISNWFLVCQRRHPASEWANLRSTGFALVLLTNGMGIP